MDWDMDMEDTAPASNLDTQGEVCIIMAPATSARDVILMSRVL